MNKNWKNFSLSEDNLLLLETQKLQQPQGERFLQFVLKKTLKGLIPLSDLQGTIDITLTDILPIPQVAAYWLGITNWQGEAVWILDLAQLLGGQHWLHKSPILYSGMVMLIQMEKQTIGLLVEQVIGIKTYDLQYCLPVAEVNINSRFKTVFKGYFLNRRDEPSMVLDIKSLFYILQS